MSHDLIDLEFQIAAVDHAIVGGRLLLIVDTLGLILAAASLCGLVSLLGF